MVHALLQSKDAVSEVRHCSYNQMHVQLHRGRVQEMQQQLKKDQSACCHLDQRDAGALLNEYCSMGVSYDMSFQSKEL